MTRITFAAAVLFAFAAVAADPKKEPMHLSDADLKWEQPMGEQGPSIASPSGDPKKGPIGFFMKFPAGFDSGWHTHDGYYLATVVKGTMTAQSMGEKEAKELPVGSFFSEPAKKAHKNTCKEGSECIIYIWQEKGFSFHPTDENGKPVKADAAKKPAEEKK